ncbi:MAG: glycosyltransferase family 4 protein [Limisphaerales bacterium]
MRIANLIMDMREVQRRYAETTPRFPGGSASLLDGFAKLPEVEVHVLSCIQQPMQSPVKLADNIWYHGLLVPKLGWLRTGYQGCIRAVRRKLGELQPDVVQGDGTERECAISAAFSGFPNVVAMQGIMSEQARLNPNRIGSYLWLTKKFEDFVLPRTAGVLCNSSYTGNLVRSRARKTWLMPHPLRQSFIHPPPAQGPRECVLLNVGMISPRKRQLELLDVAETLHRRGLKFQFRFIGYIYSAPGIAYGELFKKRIQPMEAAGYARYVGAPDDDELLRQYDAAAAMVHFASEDAAPMTVLEGVGRELKFFGARQGGAIEITQGMPGVELFDVNDWAGLTEAIARWIVEGHARPTGAAALVRERRSPIVLAKRHIEIYQEVIDQAKAKGHGRRSSHVATSCPP